MIIICTKCNEKFEASPILPELKDTEVELVICDKCHKDDNLLELYLSKINRK